MNLIPFLKPNGKYQLFDRARKEFVSSSEYDKIIVSSDRSYTVKNNDQYGILGFDGNPLIECSYEFAEGFDKNGLALVKIDQKYGCIDMSNQLVIPAIHDYISNFYDGFASVKVNSKYKFMDTAGRFLSTNEYDETSIFWDGKCAVKIDEKWGLIDKDEEIIISPQYDSLFEENGICRAELNGQYFLIDMNNRKLSENFDYMDFECDETFQVCREGLYGHIKNDGDELIPLMYENCTSFTGDYSGVFLNRKWSFINRSNNQILEPNKFNISETLGGLEDGIAVVKNDINGWGAIDLKKGNLIVDFMYDLALGFKGGLCSFLYSGKWGYFDNGGILKIDFKYSDSGYFEDGIARVAINGKLFKPDSTEFYIDDEGYEYRQK